MRRVVRPQERGGLLRSAKRGTELGKEKNVQDKVRGGAWTGPTFLHMERKEGGGFCRGEGGVKSSKQSLKKKEESRYGYRKRRTKERLNETMPATFSNQGGAGGLTEEREASYREVSAERGRRCLGLSCP